MNRWHIARIVFFSHDGRRRDVMLKPATVNIITGDSHTGKSGLAEVIDYVLGQSECHVPGIIRDATSWAGLLWAREDTQCLICRKMPVVSERTSSEYAVVVGTDIPLPIAASELAGKTTRNAALKKFEQLLGIGVVDPRPSAAAGKSPAKVSLRHVVPYLLQDDQHIINKGVLFRGGDDEHKQSIVDTLPYFLGVVDERTYAEQSTLRRLRVELEAVQRHLQLQRKLARRDFETAIALTEEARQVGLIPPASESEPAQFSLEQLREIVRNDPPLNPFPDDARLGELYDTERQLLERASGIRARSEEMKRALRAYDGYIHSTAAQRARLEAIELIPHRKGSDACPVCAQKLPRETDTVERVQAAFETVRGELAGVERDRPKLDGILGELENSRLEVSRRLRIIRRSIGGLIRESREKRRGFALEQRQYRVRGRISLFLDAVDGLNKEVEPNVAALESQIAALDERLSPGIREELDSVRVRLLDFAREIMRDLPLEERYRDNPIDFNPRTLDIGIATARRRIDMRDVGSDENYLTLHVALVLALHRIFAERERPVPGFLLFDQLSRPYYPPFVAKEAVIDSSATEVQSLRAYFRTLFAETKRQPGLQILVLEKAYFPDDAEYVSATIERWTGPEKLIPTDWPEHAP